MSTLRKYCLLLFVLVLLSNCKQNKKSAITGDGPVAVSDFLNFFKKVKLSYQFTDSILHRKEKDSTSISYKVFAQFVPDTLFNKYYGKGAKPKIYPLAKVEVKEGETYLFVKTNLSDKKAVYVLGFDKKKEFLAGFSILRSDPKSSSLQTVVFDKNYSLAKTIYKKNNDGSSSEGRDVYILNEDAKFFMLIMTDNFDDKITELMNPIDTMPRKHKLSGDYGSGKMNLVSIRDGRLKDQLTFFVHFEKNGGDCSGELKGELVMLTPTTGEYRVSGDPCVLKFNFSANSISLKETSCGSRRELNCLFDGSFAKKKYIKPAVVPKPVVKK
jgi:hypothetical protein